MSLGLDEASAPAATTTRVSAPSNHISSASTVTKSLGIPSDGFGPEDQTAAILKDEADDNLMDEEMAEEEADSLLQTTAERVAARRKMKRFR